MTRIFLLSLCLSFFLLSCETITGNISPTPYLELVSLTPDSPEEFRDSLQFTLFYRDGDGDLGENDPDAVNLWIQDNRNEVIYAYRIPALAPENAAVAIQGTLEVTLDNTSLLSDSAETFRYTIWMEDREGHKSKEIESPKVTVRPFTPR